MSALSWATFWQQRLGEGSLSCWGSLLGARSYRAQGVSSCGLQPDSFQLATFVAILALAAAKWAMAAAPANLEMEAQLESQQKRAGGQNAGNFAIQADGDEAMAPEVAGNQEARAGTGGADQKLDAPAEKAGAGVRQILQ
jgi:hypothetical protein